MEILNIKEDKKLLNQISQIREEILNSKRPFLFFDTDSDGTLSYFSLKKINKKLSGVPYKDYEEKYENNNMNYLSEENDLILFFDTPRINEELLKKIRSKFPKTKIIWLDHHKVEVKEAIEKYNIQYFNPLNYNNKDNRPSSYWAWRINGNEQDLDLAIIGSVCDFFIVKEFSKFLKNKEKYEISKFLNLKKEIEEEILNFTEKENLSEEEVSQKNKEIISKLYYKTNFGTIKFFFDFIYKMKVEDKREFSKILSLGIKEILENIESGEGKFFKDFKEFFQEEKEIYDKLKKKISNKEKIFFAKVETKYSHSRGLSERLIAENMLESTFICSKKEGEEYLACSIRSNKIDINEVIKPILKKYNSFGGGHKNSSGVRIPKKNIKKFLEEFKERANRQLNK